LEFFHPGPSAEKIPAPDLIELNPISSKMAPPEIRYACLMKKQRTRALRSKVLPLGKHPFYFGGIRNKSNPRHELQ
jgi:hypothetical protein